MILKSETYNFHRLDLTRQAGFVVTIYDEDGLRLAATTPAPTPAATFAEARKIVDNRIEGPTYDGLKCAVASPSTTLGASWCGGIGSIREQNRQHGILQYVLRRTAEYYLAQSTLSVGAFDQKVAIQ